MQPQTETALEENLKKTFHCWWHFVRGILSGGILSSGILSGHPSSYPASYCVNIVSDLAALVLFSLALEARVGSH